MDSALNVKDPEVACQHDLPQATAWCVFVFHVQGKFIREFIPELRKMPSKIPRWNQKNVFFVNTSCHAPGKYIYAPWTAPLEVQKVAGCIIGKELDGWLLMGLGMTSCLPMVQDYPKPIVDHETASKARALRPNESYHVLGG